MINPIIAPRVSWSKDDFLWLFMAVTLVDLLVDK